MKTAKHILTIALLAVSCMGVYADNVGNTAERQNNLQAEGIRPNEGYTFHRGDTIIISKEVEHYLTGEKPSTWVYYVRHIIEQVGGKRFPNGLLLHGIMSWVGQDQVYLSGAEHKDSISAAKEDVDRKEVERRQQELGDKTQAEQDAIAKAGEQHGSAELGATEEKTATFQTGNPDEINSEQIAAAMLAREKARQDSIEREQAYADSIRIEREQEIRKHEEEMQRMYQTDRFSIGVRGGAASLMHRTEAIGNWRCGFDAMLDLQYAHYWRRGSWKSAYGILTGVGIGYSRSGLGSGVDTTYTVSTPDGNIDYSISTDDINEKDGQLQLEVPLMFSMVTNKGFFLNVGPRFIVPVYSHYNQSITNPNIDAYFSEEGVHVTNDDVTGNVSEDLKNTKGRWGASKINILLGAELGYEWTLANKNSLGLGVYGNYSVYTLYNNTTLNKSLINVTAPSASGAATVDVLSATDTYAKGMGYFDCGVKLVYHFNWQK